MYCEKCGTKNELAAKFCHKCGNKLALNNNDSNIDLKSITNRVKDLPKKNKIIMSIVIGILIISIITLGILLNNPVKKLEDSLNNYYKYYNHSNRELKEIGKILISNKNEEKVLKRIKNTSHNIIKGWVKNFNTEYKNKDELKKAYDKVTGALNDIYDYYNGLEYMLDKELYDKYYEELYNLNKSKSSYLIGKEYEDKKDLYNAYYNYGKVIEIDSYYRPAASFINNYVREEFNNLKAEAEEFLKINESATDLEIYEAYIKELEFLNENKIRNNVDLESTEDYQELYNNVSSKIIEYLKKVIEEENIEEAIKKIEDTEKLFNAKEDKYQELEDLKNSYKDKLPVSLIDTYRVSKSLGVNSSLWGKNINGEDYEFYLSFTLNREKTNITYRLNKTYQRLKTKIVKDPDWTLDVKGYFLITGDDKEIYKSNIITKDSEIENIDIDVTDIDNLKIEFIAENTNIFNITNVYLVEPYLYK